MLSSNKEMNYDELSERISQDNSRTQDAQDGRMEEVSDWLRKSNQTGTAEHHRQEFPSSPHGITLPEHIAAECYAMKHGIWFEDDSNLGTIGPSGDENYCYYNADGSIIYKVNMLTHSGEHILPIFDKVRIHNELFPETRYTFIGFTNMGMLAQHFLYSVSAMCKMRRTQVWKR